MRLDLKRGGLLVCLVGSAGGKPAGSSLQNTVLYKLPSGHQCSAVPVLHVTGGCDAASAKHCLDPDLKGKVAGSWDVKNSQSRPDWFDFLRIEMNPVPIPQPTSQPGTQDRRGKGEPQPGVPLQSKACPPGVPVAGFDLTAGTRVSIEGYGSQEPLSGTVVKYDGVPEVFPNTFIVDSPGGAKKGDSGGGVFLDVSGMPVLVGTVSSSLGNLTLVSKTPKNSEYGWITIGPDGSVLGYIDFPYPKLKISISGESRWGNPMGMMISFDDEASRPDAIGLPIWYSKSSSGELKVVGQGDTYVPNHDDVGHRIYVNVPVYFDKTRSDNGEVQRVVIWVHNSSDPIQFPDSAFIDSVLAGSKPETDDDADNTLLIIGCGLLGLSVLGLTAYRCSPNRERALDQHSPSDSTPHSTSDSNSQLQPDVIGQLAQV